MDFKVSENRIWLEDADGKMVAEIALPADGADTVNFAHTFVDGSLRGQGVAGKITQAAVDKLRSEGKKATLSCSHAIRWFANHPECADVLADPEKEAAKAQALAGPACGIKLN